MNLCYLRSWFSLVLHADGWKCGINATNELQGCPFSSESGRNCELSASSITFRSVCFLVNSYVCDFACGQIHFSIKHSRRLTSEQRRNVSIIHYENIRHACIENTHCRSWFPLSLSRQILDEIFKQGYHQHITSAHTLVTDLSISSDDV